MNLKFRIYILNNFLPWLISGYIQNKISFILSLIRTGSNLTLKINSYPLKINSIANSSNVIGSLLKILRFATLFEINKEGLMKITFDNISYFEINLQKMSETDQKLIQFLSDANIYGLTVIQENKKSSYFLDDRCVFVIKNGTDLFIETFEQVRFFMKFYNYTIIETFYNRVHEISTLKKFENKIVLDVGAAIGETALYFASKRATVYAIEIDEHRYKILVEHLKINHKLSELIYPIHAALAHDGEVQYYADPEHLMDSTIIKNRFNNYFNKYEKKNIKSYSVNSIIKMNNLKTIDYLKIDCKGCEFSLTKNDLKNLSNLKIEYMVRDSSQKILELVKIIKESGFKFRTFHHSVENRKSYNVSGNILGTKEKLS